VYLSKTISVLICSFRFFGLFRFVSKQICLFRLFRNGSKTPKQTETNRKNTLLVSRNKPKINRNRLCFGLFRFEPKKKFVCFEDTLALTKATACGCKEPLLYPTPCPALEGGGERGRGCFLHSSEDLLNKNVSYT
jgi:hypothetical protein